LEFPSIGVLILAHDSFRPLGNRLGRMRAQDHPAEKAERFPVGADSADGLPDIAERMEVTAILPKRFKTGDAGKAAGMEAAGEPFAFIDSDSIPDGNEWVKKMPLLFEKPDIVFSECHALLFRPTDSTVDRRRPIEICAPDARRAFGG
jgi:hypothetical protein